MKKLLTTVIACVALTLVSRAQDPNFSQFFASPLTMNPALTGKFDGVFRVAGNYRNQWPSINNAYITGTASVDMGILKNRIPEGDQFGIGIMGFTDRAGNGALTSNYGALSVAYHKSLDENSFHQLGAGFQGTYMNKRLNSSKIVFQDQLTPFGFTGVSAETFAGQQLNLNYFDLNAGVFYNGSTNGYNNFYLGASMYHINRPKETFQQGGNFTLATRTTIQAGGKIPIGSYNFIHLAANHSMQAKAHNTIVGGSFSLNVNNDEENPTNVYLGSWYRFGDAVIPYMGLEFGEWHFGASYDVNTSQLKTASNARGGIEISLIYIKKYVDPNMRKLNCPKF
ncbi:PorP/SprF family type IX secretion system membrane protein [Terrimonas ferruginea]|uniref:PorP/SprF family type IX secretion system membrane protein n=1 Tax=Terrimonas ferruginea TaxID=249 RepID=UPI0003FBCBC0|nr:PorP/SprF family type IX secretion system membrane protein [Terrimonas ferruginea]